MFQRNKFIKVFLRRVGLVDFLFVHLYIPRWHLYIFVFSTQPLQRDVRERAASNLQRRVHPYPQEQFHHEDNTSSLPAATHAHTRTHSHAPSGMQIKIYWPLFLFHIRVRFHRDTPEKNTDTFITPFSTFFSPLPSALALLSHYPRTANFGRSSKGTTD